MARPPGACGRPAARSGRAPVRVAGRAPPHPESEEYRDRGAGRRGVGATGGRPVEPPGARPAAARKRQSARRSAERLGMSGWGKWLPGKDSNLD